MYCCWFAGCSLLAFYCLWEKSPVTFQNHFTKANSPVPYMDNVRPLSIKMWNLHCVFENHPIWFQRQVIITFCKFLCVLLLEILNMKVERTFGWKIIIYNFNLSLFLAFREFLSSIFSALISIHLVIVIWLVIFGSPLHFIFKYRNFSLLHILHSHSCFVVVHYSE